MVMAFLNRQASSAASHDDRSRDTVQDTAVQGWRMHGSVRDKKEITDRASVSSSRQFRNRLSKVPAAIDSRFARMLFRKFVDLMCGDRASQISPRVGNGERDSVARQCRRGGMEHLRQNDNCWTGTECGSSPTSPSPREIVMRR